MSLRAIQRSSGLPLHHRPRVHRLGGIDAFTWSSKDHLAEPKEHRTSNCQNLKSPSREPLACVGPQQVMTEVTLPPAMGLEGRTLSHRGLFLRLRVL